MLAGELTDNEVLDDDFSYVLGLGLLRSREEKQVPQARLPPADISRRGSLTRRRPPSLADFA